MDIRKAGVKDIDNIISLFKKFMRVHNKIVVQNEPRFKQYLTKKKGYVEIFRDFLIKHISSKDSLVLLAEAEGKPAGYCLCYIKDNIPIFSIERIGYLSDLYVDKRFRGKGISTRFKDISISWLKKKRIRHISLCVYPQNKHAHPIYKGWGFSDFHIEMRKRI
ncbi:GNAT family N-acetyltransferase [Candidatus Woesearchaeota archaeon]|nr:GNAT family N-acetyltransferase [Candidatus Woesearchaeota archaeon]